MSEPAQNPYAPPAAEVADIAGDGVQLASRGKRFAAAIVDTLVQVGALIVINLVLPWSLFDSGASVGRLFLNGLIGLGLFLAINGYLLVTRGQTVGKIALGVRIVRSDGSKVDGLRILGLRYALGFALAIVPFVGVIYSLVDSLLIFRASHKCLHDNIADTIVIKL